MVNVEASALAPNQHRSSLSLALADLRYTKAAGSTACDGMIQ